MMRLLCFSLLVAVVMAGAGDEFVKDLKGSNYKGLKTREAVAASLKKYIGTTAPACPLVDPKDAGEAQGILTQIEKESGVTCPDLTAMLKSETCIVGNKKSEEVSFLEHHSWARINRRAFSKGRSEAQTKAGLGQFFSACVTCLTANKLSEDENPEPDCNGPEGKPYTSLAEIRKDYKRQAAKGYTPPADGVIAAWKDTVESDVKACEEAAHNCYKHRHRARINQRKCMDKLGFWQTVARFWTNLRDLCVYGDVDGPSEAYLKSEAAKKCTTGSDLAKRLCICKDIIGSAARTNEKYNRLMKAE